jgi:hypothetical protein
MMEPTRTGRMAAPAAEDCFALLQQPACEIVEHCRRLATNPEAFWLPHFGFQAMALSRDWIAREPALRAIETICPIAQLGILRMPDHWVYHWHRDENRQACINMLLSTDHHSHTLFGQSINHTNMHCRELAYEPGRYYLFNNQIPHTVINLDVDRHLFSLEFAEAVPYGELRQRLASAGLLEPAANQ